jgi:enamine deaminase RidA (YjgF/YER057c/UK114 family)
MYVLRAGLAVILLIAFGASGLNAQKKKSTDEDSGYIPQVMPEGKQKKQKEDTQTPPPSRELPATVAAETDRLTFEVAPLSGKGLLSQQTREALKSLLHSSRGTIVALRAFVAGSGDLRRVGELTAEVFSDRHQPLPVLSVVQVGALPLAGAQLAIEATELDRRPVNPNGVAFLSGQSAPGISQSLEKVKTALHGAGLDPSDALRVTCFVSSLDDDKSAHALLTGNFPNAAVNFVQMQREPVTPAVECEAVARLRTAAPRAISQAVSFVNPPGLEKSPYYSHLTLVTSPKLVITGTQLAFGGQESDIKLAFERLEKTLASADARYSGLVSSHIYLTSSSMIPKLRAVRAGYYSKQQPPTSTMLPFEGLPSLDATVGLEVIAVAESPSAQR